LPAEPVVVARGLRKTYGSLVAVDDVDFEVAAGTCFGFLGPNGAGKTTTMRLIYCASPLSGGELSVLGLPVNTGRNERAIKRRLGVVPQEDNLDQDLTLRENLSVFARFYGLHGGAARARCDELLSRVGLAEKAGARVQALSGGMRRRALIARGLMGSPDLVVLDEPTTGLDPQARHRLWELVADLKRAGTTLLLTTHYMEEAERLCDTLVIMDKGRIVAGGAPQALIEELAPGYVVEVWVDPVAPPPGLAALEEDARTVTRLSDRVLLHTGDGEGLIARVAHALPGHRSLLRRSNLEDVFLEITGRELFR